MFKIILVTLCLISQYYSASSVVVDTNNAIAELVMMNYYKALNSSTSGVQAGCLPTIVTGPNGSKIQPVTGYRGSVAIIVDYGSCHTDHRGYECRVDWGDGSEQQSMHYDILTPCQMLHTYPQENCQYTVIVHYCSQSISGSSKTALTCAPYTGNIDVSYDPGRLVEL
ncbi:uncharacterized protein [Dysidea avara]|uniref:uncharacterized protein isoform X1 n=1 Tax=Dysidea avara TaxID=196820 RepID=UPI003318C950